MLAVPTPSRPPSPEPRRPLRGPLTALTALTVLTSAIPLAANRNQPLPQERFPHHFSSSSAEQLYEAENVISEPSLIRVEADEVGRLARWWEP